MGGLTERRAPRKTNLFIVMMWQCLAGNMLSGYLHLFVSRFADCRCVHDFDSDIKPQSSHECPIYSK